MKSELDPVYESVTRRGYLQVWQRPYARASRDHENRDLLQLFVLSCTKFHDNTTEKHLSSLRSYKTSSSAILLPKCAPRLDQNIVIQLTSPGQIKTTLPPMLERAVVADGPGRAQRARHKSSLLMELPPEIRCEIFRYLLSTRYTKRPLVHYDDVSNHGY